MFQKISLRLRSLFRTTAVDRDLDDEVRVHLEMQIEALVRGGMAEHEAEAAARRRFGNVTLHKEECRDKRGFAWLENTLQDFRISLRTLRRNAGFTAVSVLTLVLGIGATTALFSVLDASLLHPLTAPEPDRLVWLQEFKHSDESGGSPARLADYRRARSFSAVGGMYSEGAVWLSPSGPLQLQVLRTLGDVNGVLRAKVQTGRAFTAHEIRAVGQPVALLTARAFRQRFHSDLAILSRTIRVGGSAYQVIGILSADLDYPEDTDLWAPAPREIQDLPRTARFLGMVARLANGVSITQAQSELEILSERLAHEYPDTDGGRSVRLTPLADHVSQAIRKPMLLLFGAVASVLLIACLNIGGLLLARGMARRREAAIRVSVGAGYARLVRLFFSESLLLAGAGCVGGLLLAFGGLDVLKALLPADVPHLAAASVSLRVVLCGVAISLLAALIFGGLPAWQFAADAQANALKDGSGGSVGMRKSGLRNLFVIGEVAFSAVLVVLATLLGASFLKIRSQPVGFNSAHAYAFTVELPWDTDSKVVDAAAFEMVSRMNNFPGTIAGGVVDRLPLHGPSQSRLLQVRGKTLSTSISEKEFGFRTANAGYFAAAGIPLVSGAIYRDWPVGKKGVPEAVISQRLAEILFPGENPIGREISDQARGTGAKGKPTWFRIVGEVSSIPARPTDAEPAAELYVPWGATYWPLMNFVIRTERPLADVSRYVHEQTKHLAGADQIPSVTATLDERISETRSTPRSAALLVSGFAAAALALATLGIFGLMAHETARRTQEIGVRLALGAEPRSVAVDSVVRAAKLACVGLAAGLVAAWFASTLLKSLLFGIAPHDVFSYAMAAAMLLAAAMLASLLPALRAAQIDPVRALRHE